MKCYICDKTLSPDEIKRNPKAGHGGFDPCGTCMQIIEEVFEPLDEDEIDRLLTLEEEDEDDEIEPFV